MASISLQTSLTNNKAEIKVGDEIPVFDFKEDSAGETKPLNLTGKNIIVGLPGAYTTPCNEHVPGYVENFDKFKAKGVENIYIISVNDAFVTKSWKKHLGGDNLHFVADDTGHITSSLGFLFDASGALGSPRSKRYVLVTEGHKVLSIAVEDEVPKVTVTSADSVLAKL
ncbi:Redoxin [Coprinopsis marcescibilis]|uniref:Redoxin n=1 Tax=Coprinopsis marcescibilis TaxID=230819 RepID=A0A5C3KVN9_COPMA|nr:Redoxin [Coprinopsis marcescibilis]